MRTTVTTAQTEQPIMAQEGCDTAAGYGSLQQEDDADEAHREVESESRLGGSTTGG